VEAVEIRMRKNLHIILLYFFHRFHESYGGLQPLPHRFHTVSEESFVNYDRFHNRFHKTRRFVRVLASFPVKYQRFLTRASLPNTI
jgi:hypothetical protein